MIDVCVRGYNVDKLSELRHHRLDGALAALSIFTEVRINIFIYQLCMFGLSPDPIMHCNCVC